MALTFHYGSRSPYAWRVYFALEQQRLDVRRIEVLPYYDKTYPLHRR